MDKMISKHAREAEFLTFTSEQRLVKDEYEVAELQAAVDATGIKGIGLAGRSRMKIKI